MLSTLATVTEAVIGGATIYAATVAVVAVVGVFARQPARRRAAREVLALLLRGKRNDGGS